jgi:hypothetical protein
MREKGEGFVYVCVCVPPFRYWGLNLGSHAC